jgi:hypothetical protein
MQERSASGRIDHVMVYVSGDDVVEATLTHGQVQYMNIKEKYGCRLVDIADGGLAGKHIFFFGSFLDGDC